MVKVLFRHSALILPVLACGPTYGDGARGTTRECAPADGAAIVDACYRQCADLAEPTCKGVRKDSGNELHECVRDAAGAYLVESEDYVRPVGEDECYAVLDDADGSTMEPEDDLGTECQDVGANLQFAISRTASADVPDGVCYDFNCKTSPDAGMDCPDLE